MLDKTVGNGPVSTNYFCSSIIPATVSIEGILGKAQM